MKTRTIARTLILTVLLLSSMATPALLAGALPFLKLPQGEIKAFHLKTSDPDDEGLFDVDLRVGYGYDVEDGHYVGFCIDPRAGNVPSTRVPYSSYDPDMPKGVREYNGEPVPWDQINYMLNHRRGHWQDVQAALELLITGQSQVWEPTEISYALVDEAQTLGEDFVPSVGQEIAVILYIDGITNIEDDDQDSLIVVPLASAKGIWYETSLARRGIPSPIVTSGRICMQGTCMHSHN